MESPKSQYRIPKQIQSPNVPMTKTPQRGNLVHFRQPTNHPFPSVEFPSFEFVSYSVLRSSDLEDVHRACPFKWRFQYAHDCQHDSRHTTLLDPRRAPLPGSLGACRLPDLDVYTRPATGRGSTAATAPRVCRATWPASEPVSRRVLEQAASLRVISRNGTGINNIDLEAAVNGTLP